MMGNCPGVLRLLPVQLQKAKMLLKIEEQKGNSCVGFHSWCMEGQVRVRGGTVLDIHLAAQVYQVVAVLVDPYLVLLPSPTLNRRNLSPSTHRPLILLSMRANSPKHGLQAV